ncbi:MAG TPA: hypothetical protein VN726_00300 [Hanamia sp.]|nr:hypothetical protein [Hanamia sp.]
MKFLLIIFLFPLGVFAQDISGVWTGHLYNDTTKQFIDYELAVSEYNGQLSGYSHTTFIIDSIKNIGVKSVKVKKKSDRFLVEDDKLIYNNYPEPPAKGVKTYVTLSFSENDSAQMLTGIWHTNRTKIFTQLTGTVFLQKREKIRETLIVAKLDNLGLTPKLSFVSEPQKDPPDQKVVSSTKALSSKSDVIPKASGSTFDQSETAEKIVEEKNTTAGSKTSNKEVTRNKITANNLPKESTTQDVETSRSDKSEVATKKSKASAEKESAVNEKVLNKENVLVNNNGKKIIQELIKVPAAAEIKSRQIETIQTVEIAHDSLVLTLYDNGTVDGDTVSVLIDGKVVWPRVGLLATATNKTIHLDKSDGDSLIVVMYAENLGSIAPNTGLLVVRDGDKNYEIRFSGDLQKNSAIILKRKKKP